MLEIFRGYVSSLATIAAQYCHAPSSPGMENNTEKIHTY